jgi:purine-binding chemotaxis protein CheW
MRTEAAMETPNPRGDGSDLSLGGKYVTFCLENEEYGLPILVVREIIGMVAVTPVPQTPPYVRGVINLRGTVIPVIDLRMRFGMKQADSSRENCIIVVRAHGNDTGIVVDRMSEVVNIDSNDIQNPPAMSGDQSTDFILGIGRSADRVKLLLDIDHVVSYNDLAAAHSAESSSAQPN